MNAPGKVTVLPSTLQARVECLAQLLVTTTDDGLMVDAAAIRRNAGDVRWWRLRTGPVAGEWSHTDSDLTGHLGHVLFAIAACYEPEPPEPERPKLTPARREALEVLAWAAEHGRPVRSSDHTINMAVVDLGYQLCVHHKVVEWLEAEGLAERIDPLNYDYRLTDDGHVLALTMRSGS